MVNLQIANIIKGLPTESKATKEDILIRSGDKVFARFDAIEIKYDAAMKDLSIDFYWGEYNTMRHHIPCTDPYENVLRLNGFTGKLEGNFS